MFVRRIKTSNTITLLLITLFSLVSTVGCGVLLLSRFANMFGGTLDANPPGVILTSPADAATGVAINQKIAATFSEAMNPSSLNSAFTVTGPGAVLVAGAIAYDEANKIATFTPAGNLAINTAYTAAVTIGAQDLDGNGLAGNFTWNFTTGGTGDTTPPTVTLTDPAMSATDVGINTTVTATFSEAMDSLTITTTSFTLQGPGTTPIIGTVTYAGTVATFHPAANLPVSTIFSATITTAARDLAGNPLACNFVWNFSTGLAQDSTAPTVILTDPVDAATGVPISQIISATFSEAMDPLTISTANVTLEDATATSVTGIVTYDSINNIAVFTPAAPLAPNTTYTATITAGVQDLSGISLVSDFVWSFTTGTTVVPGSVDLGSLSTFAIVAGAGLTNSNSAGQTTINGDVGLSPTASCLGDGSPCSALNPLINGTLYANDPGGVAAAAKADLVLAYVDAAGRPPGTTVNDLSGMVLPPGVYTSGSTMSIAVGGTLTLDAQGDANGVWIFQIGSSLTVNNNAQVLLINGAKAANVYWAIFASSTLGTDVSFKGNVLAGASNSLGTGSTVEGRLLCTTGQVTLLSNTVTIPVP